MSHSICFSFNLKARAEDILGAEDDLEMNRDRAMKLFEGLVHRPGLWDIFITKYVEVSYNRFLYD